MSFWRHSHYNLHNILAIKITSCNYFYYLEVTQQSMKKKKNEEFDIQKVSQ